MMMTNGWTGAQYSLLRVALGLYVAAGITWSLLAGSRMPTEVVVAFIVATAAALAFVLGFKDRVAAVVVAALIGRLQPVVGGLLLVHALAVPSAPYGSWDARGRLDPGGGWTMPWRALMCFRVVAACACYWAYVAVRQPGVGGAQVADIALVMTLALAFAIDPSWLGESARREPSLVLYDGQCGFCHGWIRLLVAEDTDGHRFRFAPLQGERAQQALTEEERRAVGDTVVVVTPERRVLSRSEAAIHIGESLGGWWRLPTLAARLTPRAVRDAAYDAVARVRHRLASPPKEACPILPKPLRERFEV